MGRGTDTCGEDGARPGAQRVAGRPFRRWIAALVLIAGGSPAAAEDAGLRTVLFSSLDAGASVFSTSGAKVAFDRFDRDGPVVMVSAGNGMRLEGGGRLPVLVRTTLLGAALGGYQFVRPWGVVTVLAGPELSVEMLAGAGQAVLLPLRSGVRLHGEVWARPTEATLATATVILGSGRGDAWARLSWGYALFGAYLGPEAAEPRPSCDGLCPRRLPLPPLGGLPVRGAGQRVHAPEPLFRLGALERALGSCAASASSESRFPPFGPML